MGRLRAESWWKTHPLPKLMNILQAWSLHEDLSGYEKEMDLNEDSSDSFSH